MDTQLFEDLKDSLRQVKAIRQGKLEGRRTAVATIDVKANLRPGAVQRRKLQPHHNPGYLLRQHLPTEAKLKIEQ
ncbi:hypothetical protein [Castellaniella sp.]|uniref:hypothetical protein n=1 Tax=Castellaniella sp. TaxID=1955812 RepID=UPI002AFF6EC9|nr:hypothetical protein [Castellaniella sp.]